MNQTLLLFLVGAALGLNVLFTVIVAFVVERRTRLASKKCAEENHKEREAMAQEFKGLAQSNVQALLQVSRAIKDLGSRLPPRTTSKTNNEHSDSNAITALLPRVDE